MIDSLNEIFELANNATKFVKEVMELKKNNKNQDEEDLIISNSKNSAKIGSSGDSAQIGSSGDSAQIGSSGDSAVISAIGKYSIVKAKTGSWITLAEYDNNGKVLFVKTEFVDGEIIKEDTEYCLVDKQFREFIEADGIKSAILHKKGNIYKVKIFGEENESFLIKVGDDFSHGATLKQAKESLMYKISDRDTSKYDDMKLDTVLTLKDGIQMYRTITGACESGTKYFVDNLKTKKKKFTIGEIIELTKGQYNSSILQEFFNK